MDIMFFNFFGRGRGGGNWRGFHHTTILTFFFKQKTKNKKQKTKNKKQKTKNKKQKQFGITDLHRGSFKGDGKKIELLLHQGANIDAIEQVFSFFFIFF